MDQRSQSIDGTPGGATGADIPQARSRFLTLRRIARLRGSDGAIAATLEVLADERGRVEVTYEDLAHAAGTSRNTAYRSVQRLKSAGILSANRRAYRSLAIEFMKAPHDESGGADRQDRCDGDGDADGDARQHARAKSSSYRTFPSLTDAQLWTGAPATP